MTDTVATSKPLLVATLAVAAFAAWRIATLAFADHFAESDPERALEWRASLPEANLNLAEARQKEGDVAAAAEHARRAIEARPLDGRPYRVLAMLAAAAGDKEEQGRQIDLALRHGPRDPLTRATAAQLALQAGDVDAALDHYDRLLRVSPQLAAQVYPVLELIASNDASRDALVTLLQSDPPPPWRSSWLQHYAANAPPTVNIAAVFGALNAEGDLTRDELGVYLNRFVRDKDWNQAFLAWASALPAQRLASLKTPNDGNFELEQPTTGPFEWTVQPVAGVEAGVRPRADGKGRALRVEFHGARVNFRHVSQLMLLPPGEYEMQWLSRIEALQAARGLQWTVTCADGNAGRIGASQAESGTSGWRVKRMNFTVPDECPAQWLHLTLETRVANETTAMGAAWFDDLHIFRRP